MEPWKWYVYIIECKNNTYYTGMASDIEKRIEQHSSGNGSEYTRKNGFKKLAYYEEHRDFRVAQEREIQIKNWSQEKKENLINGLWDNIS